MNNTLLEYLITAYKVGDFTLTSGKQSDFYIDVKSLMYDARFLSCVSTKMLDIITSKWRDECVAWNLEAFHYQQESQLKVIHVILITPMIIL